MNMEFFQLALRKRMSSFFFVGIMLFGFSALGNVPIEALRIVTPSPTELIESRAEKKGSSTILLLSPAFNAYSTSYNKYQSLIKTRTIHVVLKNCSGPDKQFRQSFTKIFFPRTAVSSEEDHLENS